MRHGSNHGANVPGGTIVYTDRDLEIASFDSLPKPLRDLVNYAPVKIACEEIARAVARAGVVETRHILETNIVAKLGVLRGPELRPGARRYPNQRWPRIALKTRRSA